MGIGAVGAQSYSLQAIMNEYAKNLEANMTTDIGIQESTKQESDSVSISDAARNAADASARNKALSTREYALLKIRGLSDDEITQFQNSKDCAKSAANAKEFLLGLSDAERALVKKANSYALELSDSHIQSMTEEGARNMLVTQDERAYVDYNNDGVVDKGIGKMFSFPPPNAPEEVKDAWEETINALPENERLMASSIFLVESAQANLKTDAQGNPTGVYEPGEDGYTNIFPTTREGWLDLLDKTDSYLDWVESVDPSNTRLEENRALVSTFRDKLNG